MREHLPEEKIGSAEMIRKRAEECLSLATACESEASEQEAAVARLRARGERLRELAMEYRYAAHAIDNAGPRDLGRNPE